MSVLGSVRAYWLQPVEHIEVYRYHLEKVGHSLLIGAAFALFGLPSFPAVVIAVVGYLVLGKYLVRSAPSKDWIADLFIGAFAIAAERSLTGHVVTAGVITLVLALIYTIIVLRLRWAHP